MTLFARPTSHRPDPADAATSTGHAALGGPGVVPARRRAALRLLPALALTAVLAACASVQQISADVSSYGAWPTGRSAGSYAIERLPSQTRGGAEQDKLEAGARSALERAGFVPAAAVDQADVLVQVGGRQGRVLDASPWFQFGVSGWWGGRRGPYAYTSTTRRLRPGGGFGPGPFWGPYTGTYWGPWPADPTRDYREVALMLIDRASHSALVEVHVRQEARYVSDETIGAMFDAALQGFPALPEGERSVSVPVQRG